MSSTQNVQPLWQHSSLPGLAGGCGGRSCGRAAVDMVAEVGGKSVKAGIIRHSGKPSLERFLFKNHGFRVQLR